jgi:Flp pilus assembly protein TadD
MEDNLKFTAKLTIIAVLLFCLAGTAFAGKKDRKLTVGAYLSSAKIEIISGDFERYETAISYLDSLFLHYGPHAEALSLMAQIKVDYMVAETDPQKKLEYVEALVAYIDSLHMCCGNQDINKKYRKNCEKLIKLNDSTKAQYFREFYNSGIDKIEQLDDIQKGLASAADSADQVYFENQMAATVDSVELVMKMVSMLDPTDHLPYLGTSTAYEKAENFDKAIMWLARGTEAMNPADTTGQRTNLMLKAAYLNIQNDDFCGAIPFFKQYIEKVPIDTTNMGNLAICYNNCGHYDSAAMYNHQVLELDPTNFDALINIGRYHNQIARQCSDSATEARKNDNDEAAQQWMSKRDEAFDSSLVYFKRVADAYPDDIDALEQYGTIVGLKSMYEEASAVFRKLADLDTTNSEYPRAAGDFFLRSQKFDEAIAQYERTVERDPNDAETWERLADLYDNKGATEKAAAAKKKIDELK